jgi:uncharacterized protein (TIGR00730 family)
VAVDPSPATVTEDPSGSIQRIRESPTYRLAEDDTAFMESDAARASRLALEFMRADTYLRRHRINSTVVVFGSSRIKSPAEAGRALEQLQAPRNDNNPPASESAPLARARYDLLMSRYYEEARELGKALAVACNHRLGHDLVVVTGGGPGIMEGANRGASEAGAPSIGFNIRLPTEQLPNPYITPQLAFRFHYFALRKMHFLLRARALVAFPGGFGTLDELFESLNLIQTRAIHPIPIVLVGREHWRQVIDFDYLVRAGFIDEADRTLFRIVETGPEAAQSILSGYTKSKWGT